jgi:hypothetical protein
MDSYIVNDPLITVPKKDCAKGDLDFDEDVDGDDLSIFSEYFGTILLQSTENNRSQFFLIFVIRGIPEQTNSMAEEHVQENLAAILTAEVVG